MWSWISVALSGFISISAFENHKIKQALLFKNMTSALLLIMLVERVPTWPTPTIWVALGLMVTMFADSLHLLDKWPKVCFFAFLSAQLCYSKAFWIQIPGTIVWWLPALLLATSVVAFFLLLPQLDTLIFPVTIMGGVLVQLAWASGEVWLKLPSWGSLVGFLGSLILILSALLLAIHDYRRSLPYGQYWISGSYWLAQALIVASVL
ncbi:lysoplasmalogenase [Vibrio cincinnatiensis]|uniref:lysoplasmalogenase n=1 Tax=Vibrio cincinnatiensis TaxID=675 RepID=UPI0022AB0A4B|nr:lysoplasmalogenase [Vibrio cincinnatiensis]MCG3730336.1 lysoplasmalogenase [Vibrio cincinnatiensis]